MNDWPSCKTCKHWCKDFPTFDDAKPCGLAGNSDETVPVDGMTAGGLDGAGVWTGPNFSCLHHKLRIP